AKEEEVARLGRNCGLQHRAAAAQMHRQHLNAKLARRGDCFADRVRDIMKLQIEENSSSSAGDLANEFWAGCGIEFETDFVEGGDAGQSRDEAEGLGLTGKVQRHNQAVAYANPWCKRVHSVIRIRFMER